MSEVQHKLQFQCQHGDVAGIQFGQLSTDKPTIVCLHGWLDNACSFELLAPLLSQQFNVIALDFPGHGLSDPLGEGSSYYIWDMVEVLYQIEPQLKSQFGIEKYFLLGHSMGGISANLYSATFPENILGLAMLDVFGPLTDGKDQVADQLAKGIKERFKKSSGLTLYPTVDKAVEARVKSAPALSIGAIDGLVKRNLKEVAGGFQWRTDPRLRRASKVRLSDEQYQGFCEKIKAPVLVVLGEKGIVPKDWQTKRVEYYSDIEVKTLAGHHHFHLEPDHVAEISKSISEFFKKE